MYFQKIKPPKPWTIPRNKYLPYAICDENNIIFGIFLTLFTETK